MLHWFADLRQKLDGIIAPTKKINSKDITTTGSKIYCATFRTV
jgi:hypothetical protein